MASVTLSDVIDVEVYKDLTPVNDPEKTAFFQAGIAVRNSEFDALANSPSTTGTLPFWNDIDPTTEPNYSNDSNTDATPQKVDQGSQTYRVAYLNQGYQAKDLVKELTMGAEALQHVRNRIDMYWERQWQRRIIASAQGILADNVANDSGDMVYSAYSDIASPTATNKFSLANFNKAVIGTMGDAFEQLGLIAMHSAVYQTLADNNEAEDVRTSEGTLLYRSYKGHRVIIDDSLPVTTGTNSDKYLSIIFGQGAMAWGKGMPKIPVELERDASQGLGGGQETLWTRHTWLLHPFGFQSTGTPAGQSFNLAELKLATSWDRQVDRKNVNIAFLETNI